MRHTPDDFSDLEATLRQFQPASVSANLKSEIDARVRRTVSPWRFVLAIAALIAICMTAQFALKGGAHEAIVQLPSHPQPVRGNASPTWLVYHQALGQSEAALDQLLSRQSAELLPRLPGDDLRVH